MCPADDFFVSSVDSIRSSTQDMLPESDYMHSAAEYMWSAAERTNSATKAMQSATEAQHLHADSMRSVLQLVRSLTEKSALAPDAVASGMENSNSNTLHMHNEALQKRSVAQIYASWNGFILSGHDTMVSPGDLNVPANETIRSQDDRMVSGKDIYE